ncbi:MAG: efflux RND transporter periplasmic adaptor subunit [Methylophaga sp.]|nr:efflux RND transporter periplasmic adaptor subunit [Methylophaga sp.]
MKTVNKISLVIVAFLLIAVATIFVNQSIETTVKLQEIGPTHLVGNYQIQIKLNPEKPKIGNNQLTLAIRDNNDQPVTNVKLDIYAEMPAMGSMQAMREQVSIENFQTGLYQGHYSLPMNGSWPLFITLESEAQGKAQALFDMNTSRSGVKLEQATPSKLTLQTKESSVSEQKPATFKVDNYRRQLIGVTTTEVVCQPLIKTIYAGARVTYDQSKITDISLKYDAWIGKLNADYLGKQVHQGDTLFTVYSPELLSVQDEYLNALKQSHSYGLRKAAEKRLRRWGIHSAQIKTIQQRGRAIDYLPIISPANGTIIDTNIVAGSAAKIGTRLLRLADLSTVWVEGEVYESDLPWLKVGMEAKITLPELPDNSYTATVTYIDSILDPLTHSAVIRVQLNNTDKLLRPNMYANMNLQVDLGERMIVPEQAVIYSGEQRIVFIDKGEGRLLPRKIKTGLRNNDMIEVLDGLKIGETVVTSGNFLIAAESKLKAGLAQW